MASFSALIKGNIPVLVDFYADWCGPCQSMHPELDKLKKKFSDGLLIVKVNVDKNKHAADAYNVRGVPTLILFQKGVVKWRQSGAMTANQLEQIVRSKTS